MEILLAEHDPLLASFVSESLASEQYQVHLAGSGADAQQMALDGQFRLMVVDMNLFHPGVSGGLAPVLARLRSARPGLGIMVLADPSRLEERIRLLDAGADDLLMKPFAFAEMAARIRALLRRDASTNTAVLKVADLTLDRMVRRVQRGSRSLELSSKEFALLEYLMLHAGEVVSRAQIIVDVWHLSTGITTNVVDVYVNYLRRKVDPAPVPRLIQTVRGSGYRIQMLTEAEDSRTALPERCFSHRFESHNSSTMKGALPLCQL